MRDKSPKLLVPLIIGAVVALSAATGVVWSKKDNRQAAQETTASQSVAAANTNTTADDYFTYDGVEGQTALALLKAEADVVTKDSAYGPYVDTINGVVGGTDGKYWAFYVNGQMAQVGADAYVTKAGDKIEWKFE